MSNKRENFVSNAEKHTENAIKSIEKIAKLSDGGKYQYSEEDIKQIATALKASIKDMEQTFLNPVQKSAFKLK